MRQNSLLMAVVATIGFIGFLLASQGVFNEDNWWAIYYPNGDDLTQYTDLGRHASLELCCAAVADHLLVTDAVDGTFDFECGLNCVQMTDDFDKYTCETSQK